MDLKSIVGVDWLKRKRGRNMKEPIFKNSNSYYIELQQNKQFVYKWIMKNVFQMYINFMKMFFLFILLWWKLKYGIVIFLNLICHTLFMVLELNFNSCMFCFIKVDSLMKDFIGWDEVGFYIFNLSCIIYAGKIKN